MKKTFLLALAFTGIATSALARPAVCIRQDDISNWTSLNDKQIVLENYQHQKALLKLIGTCSGFKFTDRLEIRSPGAMGISCISPGDDIVTRQSGFHGRCSVVSIEPYTGPAAHGGDHHDHDSH
jgi:hypothetical protein